jgi:hypothetical protein
MQGGAHGRRTCSSNFKCCSRTDDISDGSLFDNCNGDSLDNRCSDNGSRAVFEACIHDSSCAGHCDNLSNGDTREYAINLSRRCCHNVINRDKVGQSTRQRRGNAFRRDSMLASHSNSCLVIMHGARRSYRLPGLELGFGRGNGMVDCSNIISRSRFDGRGFSQRHCASRTGSAVVIVDCTKSRDSLVSSASAYTFEFVDVRLVSHAADATPDVICSASTKLDHVSNEVQRGKLRSIKTYQSTL